MEQKLKTSPKDFFLYLLSAGLLYYNVVWFITLLHQYINKFFPSAQDSYYYGYDTGLNSTMRWAIASLLVAFPIYIIIARMLNTDVDAHPEKRSLGIRRWLTYFTLFAAGVTMIVDVIALIFNLLEGDFAMRFILKAVAILLVAALVFGYYFYELRRDAGKDAPQRSLFRWIAIFAVGISIIAAFFVVGSPKTAREMGYDQARTNDLQNIQWQIISYWQNKSSLPTELSDLEDTISGFRIPIDPDKTSKNTYEYEVTGTYSFNLCATFSQSSEQTSSRESLGVYGVEQLGNWAHDAGRVCFERTIDPDLYPGRTSVK